MYFIGVIVFGSLAISDGLANLLTPVDKDSHIKLSRRKSFIFWILIVYGFVQWWQNF